MSPVNYWNLIQIFFQNIVNLLIEANLKDPTSDVHTHGVQTYEYGHNSWHRSDTRKVHMRTYTSRCHAFPTARNSFYIQGAQNINIEALFFTTTPLSHMQYVHDAL